MTDPEHGIMPSKIGAPAKGPPEKAATSGPDGMPTGGDVAPRAGPSRQDGTERPDAGAERAQSASSSKNEDSRRRKRRRSRRGRGKSANDAAAPEPNAAQGKGSGNGSGNRHAKSRNRKRRAFQGRPLAAEDQPPRVVAECGPAAAAKPQSTSSAPGDRAPSPGGDTLDRRNGQRGPSRANDPQAGPLYAALDLGTNNCRLLVAQPTRPGQFRVVDAFSRIVRLGEGLIGSGRLSDNAMDRAVEALRVCSVKLRNRPIRNMRLIATEACRAAENGADFLSRVKLETGLDLEIVDRETEARLAVSGCASLVERDARSVVLFDIGGGSSEIAVIELANRTNRLANHIKAWTSLPVGVVTLSEQHGGREVTREIFAAMVRDVEAMLARFDCPGSLTGHSVGESAGFHLLGTSGTVTTLAGIHLDLPRYDRRRVDGLWLTSGEVDLMLERLLSWDFQQRSANPCIGADRADLVLAGCAILEAIRKRWPAERMRVADRGLREGLLTEMMVADGVWRRQRRGRRSHLRVSTRGEA